MKVLILGSNGMIGSTVLRVLSVQKDWDVYGSVREENCKDLFLESIVKRLFTGVDILSTDGLVNILSQLRPDVVVNCAGLTKHKPKSNDPLASVPINTLAPHRLAHLCNLVGARLIHISTDCVFSGAKGNYVESDLTDAGDVYGRSKALGEVTYSNTVTLRTSTIGHELCTRFGLLDWFLSQDGHCKGYTNAIFSGLPTVVFAEIVRDIIIPSKHLSGIYHIAANPISKYDLLCLIANTYNKSIEIIRDDSITIDRSLNASRFRLATGYLAPEWPELIKLMHLFK